jgi:hypothetical protein
MRRPKWPPLIPLPPRATDRFDLPRTSLLSEACESAEERKARLRTVRRQAFMFYKTVCDQLGQDETKKLFDGFWKRRPGRQRGPTNPDRDRALLEEYDDRHALTTSDAERERLPREIGHLANDRFPGVFGNSASAIEKHLRRLTTSRERRQSLIAARSRRWARGQHQTSSHLIEEIENDPPKEPDTN